MLSMNTKINSYAVGIKIFAYKKDVYTLVTTKSFGFQIFMVLY